MIDQSNIYSIKDITNYIKTIVDNDPILTEVWVRGEISNFNHHYSGHMYFTLKDEASRLRSIMFGGNNRFLKFVPKDGMKVIAKGYVSVYERDGQYQLYIQEMQPDGIGQLFLAYEQLKNKLEEEGLFKQEIKKNLPPFPQTIGVITSSTGAAIRDIITTLKRRFPLVNILISPVIVQGEYAAESIATAIRQMNKHGEADLLIVGRGGGSIEELWAFNEEIVARSIYESKVPVISAVGHETDFTIADFVADVRAATPTAAAELAVPHLGELKTSLTFLEKQLERQTIKQLEVARSALSQILKSVVFKRPKQQVMDYIQRVDRLEERLKHSLSHTKSKHKEKLFIIHQRLIQERPNDKVKNHKDKLSHLKKQLIFEINQLKNTYQNKLDLRLSKLDALSPLKVMQRGYALTYNEKGNKLIKSTKDVQLGDIIKLYLTDGNLSCQVWGMEENRNEGK